METLLKDFCLKDIERPSMLRPWLRHGVVRATNGHILIHVPEHILPGHSVEPNDDAPDTDKIFNNILLFTDSYALDTVALDKRIALKADCYDVFNEGRCINCEGTGKETCHICHEGTVECNECGGTGKIKLNILKHEPPPFSQQTVDIYGKRFNWNYLKLVSRAVMVFGGEWRIAPARDNIGHAPTVFRNTDGVKIGLMEIKK